MARNSMYCMGIALDASIRGLHRALAKLFSGSSIFIAIDAEKLLVKETLVNSTLLLSRILMQFQSYVYATIQQRY